MKISIKKLLFAVTFLVTSISAQAAPLYVGSWDLYNSSGPEWAIFTSPTYTAQEAAAAIFGGLASHYAISTAGPSPLAIDNMAWLDQIYIGVAKFGESYRFDENNNGVYDTLGDTSAWVKDNGCCGQYINYAFRIDDQPNPVPAPATLTLFGLGLASLNFMRRRRKTS